MKTYKLFSITLFIVLLLLSTFVQDAQSGNSKQTRTVSEFHGISVSGGIDLYLSQKNIQELRVEADQEDLKNVITEVEGGILKINIRETSWLQLNWIHTSRKVYVSFKTLDMLKASAGSDIASQSTLNLDKLEVDASSGSDIKLKLNASEVSAKSSSGSDIELKGKAISFQVNASSGSDINAADFHTKRSNVNVSSGSNIQVYVTEQLEAQASSGGDIDYSGNPARKKIKKSSGGGIHEK